MSDDGLEALEASLGARPRAAPAAALRGRVLGALERERRAEARAWCLMAAATWIAVGATWLSEDPRTERLGGPTDVRALAERLERGPEPAELPRLARPIGSLAGLAP